MRVIAAICSVLLLSSCAGTCPGLKEYSKPEQQRIAKERNALPDDSALLSPLEEWETLRRACR